MTTLVADCPRCNTKNITFDVKGFVVLNVVHYGWQHFAEVFCRCRHCTTTTTFRVAQRKTEHAVIFQPDQWRVENRSLNSYVEIERFIGLRDRSTHDPPAHVTPEIASAFQQGSTCITVECWDAAGAMFRKALDLATTPLLPNEEREGLNNKTRRDLAPRLAWLFSNNLLGADLRSLAECIRQDGNDAAHQQALTKEDALDLLEFTHALLERLYTEPGKLKAAEARRTARRTATA